MPIQPREVTERLVARIVDSWGPVLVEACDGSGKQVLARATARKIGVERLTRLSDENWEELLCADEPIVLVEGEASALDLSIDERLAAALGARLSEQPCLILARQVGPGVEAARRRSQLLHLNEHDLWFSVDALQELFDADHPTAVAIHESSNGWPAVVSDVAEQLRGTSLRPDWQAVLSTAMSRRLRGALAELPPRHHDLLSQLATLRSFDSEVLLRLGVADALGDLSRAGIPLPVTGAGWRRLMPAVRTWVRYELPRPAAKVDPKLLHYLKTAGLPVEAAACAIDHGQRQEAAALLADLTVDQAVAVDHARLEAMCKRLGEYEDLYPRLRIVRARSSVVLGSLTDAVAILEECRSGVDSGDLDDELRVDIGMFHYHLGNLETAGSLILGAHNVCADPRIEAHRLHVEAGLSALESTEEGLDRAVVLWGRATALYDAVDARSESARVQGFIAIEVEAKRGRLASAIELLRQVEARSVATGARATHGRMIRARFHADMGDAEAVFACIAQSEVMINATGDQWADLYAKDALMRIAGVEGDVGRVRELDAQIRASKQTDDATSPILAAGAAYAYLALDEEEDLRRSVNEVVEHPAAEPHAIATLQMVLECVYGDPRIGRSLVAEVLASPLVVDQGNWRAHVADAVAAARLGDSDEADQLLDLARRDASLRGIPGHIERTQSWALRLIDGSRQPAARAAERSGCHVQLFGGFLVSTHGVPVDLPPSLGRTLLKLLIFNGGSLPLEQAVDALWPAADLANGKRRMRNILNRLRARCGPIIDRDGSTLRLVDGELSSDFAQWTQETRVILSTADSVAGDVDRLLEEAPNDLSVEDRSEAWFEPFGRTWRVDLLRLIDRRIELAIAARDPQTALALYHRSLDIEPGAHARIESAVNLALSVGLPDDAATFELRR